MGANPNSQGSMNMIPGGLSGTGFGNLVAEGMGRGMQGQVNVVGTDWPACAIQC
jgi:hypothetical protein